MKRKIKKSESGVIPVVVLVVITVILAAVIAAFVFVVGENQYFEIQTEQLNEDLLLVKILNYTNNSPLPNVTIKVSEYGEGRLLSGPYITNESGYAIIQIPNGYNKYFNIVMEYKNVTNTETIDKRSPLVKSEAYLGSLGTDLIITFVGIGVGIVGWFLGGSRIKKASKKKNRIQKNK